MNRILLNIFFFFLIYVSNSQDLHNSQFYMNPLSVNPALAGFSKCYYRCGIDYRSQWGSVTTPYSTQSAFGDAKIKPDPNSNDWLGVGITVSKDAAGDGNLSTSRMMLNGSYYKALNSSKTLFTAIGFGAGFGNRSVDYSKLHFEDQWDGNGFNANFNSNEKGFNSSVFYPDLNTGMLICYFPYFKSEYYLGGSISHVNRPKDLFYSDGVINRRYTVHGGIHGRLNRMISYKTDFIFNSQGGASELLLGVNLIHHLLKGNFYLGAWYRNGSDIIPTMGFEVEQFIVLMSYDVNVSTLNPASNYKGGLELSVVKSFKCTKSRTKYTIRDNGSIPCPSF